MDQSLAYTTQIRDASAPKLSIRLFGNLEVRLRGTLMKIPSRRSGWLLALLILREGQPIGRETLAATLWPESTDAGGLHNLRQTLAGLRKALGEAGSLIHGESARTLAWQESNDSWIDVREFDAALKAGGRLALERAQALYMGPLIGDCDEPFADEPRSVREAGLLSATDRLCEIYASEGEFKSMIPLLQRALTLDPYRDATCRMLMKALSADGQTAAVHETYRKFSRQLRGDLDSEPDSETRELYRVLRKKTKFGPRLKPVSSARRTLPNPVSDFVGRTADILEVSELVKRCRLVTLAGIGGVGKTRLALAVAHSLEEHFADGARFVDLSPITETTSLEATVAAALDIPESPSTGIREVLTNYLRSQELLLVVDNCEHLLKGSAELLDYLLSHSAGLHILATSRQTLDVAGEWVWRVAPLSSEDSKALFLARATQLGTLRNPSQAEFQETGAICQTLDGLPLAIELAAARTKVMTLFEIHSRLKDRFAFLASGTSSQMRHKTLEAAIDWSWDLLGDAEKDLLISLTTFRGGAVLTGLAAVSGTDEESVMDILTNLIDKSLVLPVSVEHGMRFTLLETIRQFVQGKVQGSSVWKQRLGRHCDYFLDWLRSRTPTQNTPDEAIWFRDVEAEQDNFRAAIEWSHAVRDGERMLEFVTRLARFWDTYGHVTEGRDRIERALRDVPKGTSERLIALAHGNAAWIATIQGQPLAALEHYRASLPYFRRAGDDFELAFVLNTLASATYAAGDFESAHSEFQESLSIFRRLGRSGGTAAVLNNLGELALATGDIEKARNYIEESLECGGGLHEGNPERRGLILCNLAVAEIRQGRFEAALMHVLFAIDLFFEASVVVSIPSALSLLSIIECQNKKWERAAWLLGASEGLADAKGMPLPKLTSKERAESHQELSRQLGTTEFEKLRSIGTSAGLQKAIEYARS